MKLPPMNALRAFEAVSRHSSVSKAAEELCVSQGAVSQQLRNLENHLGREMFIRTPKSFTLSEEGEAFAVVVQRALADIALAAGVAARTKTCRSLTISVSPNFAVKWLMPRLGSFYEVCPDVSVAFDQSVDLVTFKNDGVDAAIRFGDGNFDGLDSTFLFRSRVFAVASPEYIAEHGELKSLSKPDKHHLIDYYYTSKDIRSQHIHWEDLVPGSLSDLDIQHEVFPDDNQTLNAAIQGRGIALIVEYLMEEELEKGTIQYVNDQFIPSRFSYYFVSPSDARPNCDLIVFRDWLVDNLKKYSE